MSLSTLPKELLLMMTDYLPLLSIESLALTLNKNITLICLSLLEPLFIRRRNKTLMESRFGGFRTKTLYYASRYLDENSWTSRDDLKNARALFRVPESAELLPKGSFDPMFALEYLDLNEDLHWLAPVDKKTDQNQEGHKTRSAMMQEELNEILVAAEKADVKLPASFVKLATNLELMNRIPTGGSYFHIGGGLRRVPAAVDTAAGGYIVRLYCDQQGCGFWSLYIEAGEEGRNCVLGTSQDAGQYQWGYGLHDNDDEGWENFSATTEERERASIEGLKMARMHVDDVSFEGLTFEQWLALIYFESWLSLSLGGGFGAEVEDGEALEPLREYVRHNYFK
ncbi:hypothetical protein K505DRAFT_328676 [Melanomma pulvis-pyrius CBS 109.77]|uniref:Uncharacterized protein n=1 Tax=Melanomma pulvis-pyrius CBS 109.77 TaxID=1314802 RepID=A0A6A6WYI7_9PLEO|nr:hypothetical protein K505DRAFT_328676 [Melanomma pulvis-pyrius CBS 109.77]